MVSPMTEDFVDKIMIKKSLSFIKTVYFCVLQIIDAQ